MLAVPTNGAMTPSELPDGSVSYSGLDASAASATSSVPGASSSSATDQRLQLNQLSTCADKLWGPRKSIEERLGDVQGSLRWKTIERLYVISSQFTLKLYDAQTKRWLVRRHRTNQRGVNTAVNKCPRHLKHWRHVCHAWSHPCHPRYRIGSR